MAQVRDVCMSCDTVVSLEERGRVHVWRRGVGGSGGGAAAAAAWRRDAAFEGQVHATLAFVLASVEGCAVRDEQSSQVPHVYPPGTVMTGGGDKTARPFTVHGQHHAPHNRDTKCRGKHAQCEAIA